MKPPLKKTLFYLHPAPLRSSPTRPSPSSRWGRKLTLGILGIVIGIWAWQKLSNPSTFPIQKVHIIGPQQHLNQDQLRQIITPYISQGMLWLKSKELINTLQQIPWINRATIQRHWPNQLIIHIQQQIPIAHWNQTQLINNQLEIFTPGNSAVQENLPWLESADNQQSQLLWHTYQQLNAPLLQIGLSIKHLLLTSNQTWLVQLNNGLTLMLGQDNLATRLTHFIQIYPQFSPRQRQQIRYIDLRYPNGLAVEWKNSQ